MTFEELAEFDRRMSEEKGISVLCGVDEAGRGPLAGPVVAACLVAYALLRYKSGKTKINPVYEFED